LQFAVTSLIGGHAVQKLRDNLTIIPIQRFFAWHIFYCANYSTHREDADLWRRSQSIIITV